MRNSEQLFGGALFDDWDCKKANGAIGTRIYEPFILALHRKRGRMNEWIKTCCTVTSTSVVRMIHNPATVIVTIILLGSNALPQSDPERLGMSANELARKVVTNELKFQDEDHSHWMYRLEKEESGRNRSRKSSRQTMVLSVDSSPLTAIHSTAKQQQKENQRMQSLVSHPDEQRKLQQASTKKTEQGARLFNILADVFVFGYAGRQGDLVTLTFRPNPTFQPPSLEARVLHGMQGEMTVDTKQERLAALNGHLMEDVKFGGGLLGHLDKGGKFEVRQSEVAPGHWEMTYPGCGHERKGSPLQDYRRAGDRKPQRLPPSAR